jgi:hypothetical protein
VKESFKMDYKKGFIKQAGIKTELIGSAYGMPINLAPLAAGMYAGPLTDNDLAAQDKKTWSNALIPLLGPYRLGRRIATDKLKSQVALAKQVRDEMAQP